ASADLNQRGPVCIFGTEKGQETLNAEELQQLLCGNDENLKKRKVVVVAVNGRYRTGKSFILNFFIRYLRSNRSPNWLDGKSDDTVTGFPWKHSRKGVTHGVLIWPELFELQLPNREKVAVVLIDTQGLYDPMV
ncbi:hypothetical protein BIW11_02296, partial [Tropilaelaps mercedesae]